MLYSIQKSHREGKLRKSNCVHEVIINPQGPWRWDHNTGHHRQNANTLRCSTGDHVGRKAMGIPGRENKAKKTVGRKDHRESSGREKFINNIWIFRLGKSFLHLNNKNCYLLSTSTKQAPLYVLYNYWPI